MYSNGVLVIIDIIVLVAYDTQLGIQCFFNEDIKTWDASVIYSLLNCSAINDVSNLILSILNSLIDFLIEKNKNNIWYIFVF